MKVCEGDGSAVRQIPLVHCCRDAWEVCKLARITKGLQCCRVGGVAKALVEEVHVFRVKL
jgi:hypothetical protein